MKRLAAAIACATTVSTAAFATELPPPMPTARDMYVACYLLAHDTEVPKGANGGPELFSAESCSLASVSLIANREGKDNPNKYRFCLDRSAGVTANPSKAMAFAYLDFYESSAIKDRGMGGLSAYLFAMTMRWPCPQ